MVLEVASEAARQPVQFFQVETLQRKPSSAMLNLFGLNSVIEKRMSRAWSFSFHARNLSQTVSIQRPRTPCLGTPSDDD